MFKNLYLAFTLYLLSTVLVTGCSQTNFAKGTAEKTMYAITAESIETLKTSTYSLTRTPSQTSTNTPSPTRSETPTPTPTQKLIPTTTPYNKTPEQMEDGWEVGTLINADINPIRISRMLEFIYHGQKSGDSPKLPNGLPKYKNIHSILIIKDNRLVFEEYFYDYRQENQHDLASVTKSITSLLIGLTIDQGYLEGVEEKILTYFSEYLPLQRPDERAENITIEDLLTMRSGWECDDWNPASRAYYLKMQPMEISTILNFPMNRPPGFAFSYCTSGTVVLNAVIARASGMDLTQFGSQYLLEPLGIEDVTWDWEYSYGGFGGILLMRPRDMAKIGLLVLQNGNWQGKQIIQEDWIEQSVQKHVSLSYNKSWGNGYGYLWWLSDVRYGEIMIHSFSASGHGGQLITVIPELEMVVVITGGNYHNDEGQSFQIMERFILPAVLGY